MNVTRCGRHILYCAGALLLVFCTACSGTASQPGDVAGVNAAPGGLSLPNPAELPQSGQRRTSYAPADLWSNGADYDAALGHQLVSADGSTGAFSPDFPAGGIAGLAYGIYRFDLPGYDGAAKLRLIWGASAPAAGAAWLGLANFNKNSWEWYEVPGEGTVTPSGMAPYFNGSGSLFAAVVLMGDTACDLSRIRIGNVVLNGELTATPLTGLAPLTVHFDASGLTFNGASVIDYEWDFAGDGTFETDTNTTATTDHEYTTGGMFNAAVRLDSDEGDSAVAQVLVRPLSGTWELQDLVDPPDSNYNYDQPRIAVVNGNLALAYLQNHDIPVGPGTATEHTLEYIHADATQSQAGWSAPVEAVPATGDAQELCALTEVDGNPAVCYRTGANELYYQRAADPQGQDWSVPAVQILVNTIDGGFSATMDVTADRPVIACIPRTDYKNVAFSIGDDADGTTWTIPVDVWSQGFTVYGPVSLCTYNDLPAVAVATLDFHGEVDRATELDGKYGWTSSYAIMPDTDLSVGLIRGYLAVVGRNSETGTAQVGWAPDLSTYWLNQECDSTPDTGAYSSWGGPCLNYDAAFCYQDATNENLRFCGLNLSEDAQTVTPTPELVDDADHTGYMCTVAVLDGVPAIGYVQYGGEPGTEGAIHVAIIR